MAITINWLTKVINVPQADLTNLGGGVYELDIDVFRLALKDIEDSEDGAVFLDTHRHVAPITIGNFTLARVIEIINGYTVTFQDTGTPYAVNLVGANSNIADVTNINNVSVRPSNSAGLVQVSGAGGGATADEVWDEAIEGGWTAREMMRIMASLLAGKTSGAGTGVETFRDIDDTKDRIVASVTPAGNRTAITIDPS